METLGLIFVLIAVFAITYLRLGDILDELKKLNTHKSTEEIKKQEIIDKTNNQDNGKGNKKANN